jgi:L-asparagine transporter-like permease
VYKSFKEFIFQETIFAAAITLTGYFLFTGPLEYYYRNVIPLLLVVVYLLTAAVHGFLLHTHSREPQKFITKYMLTSGIKILLYLIFIIIYLLLVPENAAIFLLSFLSFYFLFTLFEVFSIHRILKKNSTD